MCFSKHNCLALWSKPWSREDTISISVNTFHFRERSSLVTNILTRNLETQLKRKALWKKKTKQTLTVYLYDSSIISQQSRRNYSQNKTLHSIHALKDFTWVLMGAKPPNADTQLLWLVQTPLAQTICAPVVKTLTNVGFIKGRKWVGSLILVKRVIFWGKGFSLLLLYFGGVFFTNFQEQTLHKNIR